MDETRGQVAVYGARSSARTTSLTATATATYLTSGVAIWGTCAVFLACAASRLWPRRWDVPRAQRYGPAPATEILTHYYTGVEITGEQRRDDTAWRQAAAKYLVSHPGSPASWGHRAGRSWRPMAPD